MGGESEEGRGREAEDGAAHAECTAEGEGWAPSGEVRYFPLGFYVWLFIQAFLGRK